MPAPFPPVVSGLMLALVAMPLGLSAQSASSTWFLPAWRCGPGAMSQSSNWVLASSLGLDASGVPSTSANYVVVAGFGGVIGSPVTGRPWITGVSPGRAGLLGGTPLTVHGTDLHLAGGATLTIGGVLAPVISPTSSSFQTVLPAQQQPGPRPVRLDSVFGTSVLPTGIGVLPMIEWKAPPRSNEPSELVYHGRLGDLFLIVLAFGPAPFPMPFAPLHYGLAVDPTVLLTSGVIGVGDPGGVAVLPFPGLPTVSGMYFQAAALTVDPSYSLGSFSNVLSIH